MACRQAIGRLYGQWSIGSPFLTWGQDCTGFFIVVDDEIILLHGIIKKTRTAPKQELDTVRKRQTSYMKEQQKNKKP